MLETAAAKKAVTVVPMLAPRMMAKALSMLTRPCCPMITRILMGMDEAWTIPVKITPMATPKTGCCAS